MDFHFFEDNFLYNLKNQKDECILNIDNNEDTVKTFLGPRDSKYSRNFMKEVIKIVVETENNFSIIERALIHDYFTYVLARFRESNVLIKACERGNESAIRWLLTMNINLCMKDENGLTALIHAVKHRHLVPIVCSLIDNDEDYNTLNMTDKNGNNTLFHAINNLNAFRVLLDSSLNVNHLNYDNDSILTYCCKNKIYHPLKYLFRNKNVYLNIFNNDERTAVMYLAEDGRYKELSMLKQCVNFDYKNSANETVLSLLLNKYYKLYQSVEDTKVLLPYLNILKYLVEKKININVPIDQEGNTPLMFFILLEDWNTILFLLLKCKNLDLSIKNKRGINATCLCSLINPDNCKKVRGINIGSIGKLCLHHKTFDIDFRDQYGNNLLMYYILNCNVNSFLDLIKRNNRFVSDINNKKENALIMAVKLRRRHFIKTIINTQGNNINQQDYLGNTALHYAIELKDKYISDILAFYRADINIKNNNGLSPYDLALSQPDEYFKEMLDKPVFPYKILEKEKKKSRFSLFRKNKDEEPDPNISLSDIKVSDYREKYEVYMNDKSIRQYTVSNSPILVNHLQLEAKNIYNVTNPKGRIVEFGIPVQDLYDINITEMSFNSTETGVLRNFSRSSRDSGYVDGE